MDGGYGREREECDDVDMEEEEEEEVEHLPSMHKALGSIASTVKMISCCKYLWKFNNGN